MKPYKSKDYLIQQTKMKTQHQIAKENNVDITTINRNLRKFNLTTPSKKWNSYELELLNNLYAEDRAIFNKLNKRSLSGIYHKAYRLGIHREVKPLKYKINENFFSDWSKGLSYFLGFFMADGHIDYKKCSASIKIQERDGYILDKFLGLLQYNSPIRYYDGYPSLRINNKIIVKRLINLGCKPGNSINNKYPKSIPDKYFFHFLRGYIDGDGSIYICRSKRSKQKNVLRVSIFGSKEFLKTLIIKISYFLHKRIAYKIRPSHPHSDILYTVTLNGKLARMLCGKMYHKCDDLYLKRKREKFNEHLLYLTKNG